MRTSLLYLILLLNRASWLFRKNNVVTTSESPKEAKKTVGNNSDALVCACCSKHHRLYKCQRFIAMNSRGRYKLVRSKNLCYRLLSGGHQKDCDDEKGVCTVEGCDKLHYRLLHFMESSDKSPSKETDPNAVCSVVDANVARPKVSGLSIYLNVVPVVVSHGEKRIATYAFLDPGSSVSFCEKKLMDKLDTVGSPKSINIQTLTGPRMLDTVAVSMSVEPVRGGYRLDLTEVVAMKFL